MQLESLARLVRPRVFDPGSEHGEPRLLEDAVAARLVRAERGLVRITGPFGAGKTSALRFLASYFAGRRDLRLVDDASRSDIGDQRPDELVVCASDDDVETRPEDELRLAPWGRDEIIEYLLAAHKERCAELLHRLEASADAQDHAGLPAIVCIALDEMAEHDDVLDVAAAIRRRFEAASLDAAERSSLRSICLLHRLDPESPRWTPSIRLLRLPAVQAVLAADAIVAALARGAGTKELERALPPDLQRATVTALRASPAVLPRLLVIAECPVRSAVRNALELSNGVDPRAIAGWIDALTNRGLPIPGLDMARLPGVDLENVRAARISLRHADLSRANLERCDLSAVHADHVVLSSANLRQAFLDNCRARNAQLVRADLRDVSANDVEWSGAELKEADLRAAKFARSVLRFACLDGANATGASFSHADLTHASVEGARLVDVDFTNANLSGVKLRLAQLASRLFATANLEGCSMEGVVLDASQFTAANLSRALLTGSRMHDACFERARLDGAGLADVDWEGANLRGASLKHASFHMGSSRSGLVFHGAPMEGSRTGFYAEEFLQSGYKAPEEVRKANLRRADLRDAEIFETDFYLVDLRGALYDAHQAEHLRRCGAILDGWARR